MRTLLHCVLALSFAVPAICSATEFEVEALAGAKQLLLDDYEGLALQSEAGVRVSAPLGEGSAISLVGELLEGRVARRGEGYGVGLATHEIAAGIRVRIGSGAIQGFAGAGPSVISTDLVAAYPERGFHTHQNELGVWYSTGVRARLTPRVSSSVEVRRTLALAADAGQAPASGDHVLVSLSCRFGRTK